MVKETPAHKKSHVEQGKIYAQVIVILQLQKTDLWGVVNPLVKILLLMMEHVAYLVILDTLFQENNLDVITV